MIKNIIFGKNSILTKYVAKKIKHVKIYSLNSLNTNELNFREGKVNIIFNNFYPSFKLNDLNPSQYEEFVELSLSKLSLILSIVSLFTVALSSVNDIPSFGL